MTETEFRFKHSEIIEYYQLIEMRLKGICAALMADGNKGWYERLAEYEHDPMKRLIDGIDTIQDQKETKPFSKEDFDALDDLRKTRNYWAHDCFAGNHHVCFKNGEVRNPKHVERIMADFETAIAWDKKLAKIFRGFKKERLVFKV